MSTIKPGLLPETAQALNLLQALMVAHKQAVVAFSGGMDSSLLALAAQRYIPDGYLAILVNSEFMSANEMRIARAIAQKHSLRFREIKIIALDEPLVAANPPLRCYHCKKVIFKKILAEAQPGQTVYEGSVTDDNDDYRPGKKAIKELAITSPLLECGFSKAMVGEVLQHWGAANLIRPAQSCLATRIETDTPIDKAVLQQIEKAEELLREHGLAYCRLRHHNNIARIEVAPDQIHRALDIIASLAQPLKSLGYQHVCIDAGGYQKGSMNRPTGQSS